MSLHSERHLDATNAADQPDERLTVSQWHELLVRCTFAAWRRAAVRQTFTEMYATVDAALQTALPEKYPETKP